MAKEGTANRIVLVSDPDPTTAAFFTKRLANKGYEVLSITDSVSTAAIARMRSPQLIVLAGDSSADLDLSRSIRDDPALSGVHLVMVRSTPANRPLLGHWLSGCADLYVRKPLDRGFLDDQLDRLLVPQSSEDAPSKASGKTRGRGKIKARSKLREKWAGRTAELEALSTAEVAALEIDLDVAGDEPISPPLVQEAAAAPGTDGGARPKRQRLTGKPVPPCKRDAAGSLEVQ